MNPSLLNTLLFFNRISAYIQEKNHLHTSRFAHNFELLPLMSNTFDSGGLLIGEGAYNQILRVRKTPERPQLRNMLIVARTGGGKGLLAIPQILTWPNSLIVNDIKGVVPIIVSKV